MRRDRGLSVIEILIVVICVLLAFLFLPRLLLDGGRGHPPAYKVRCQSNLSQIAKAMNMYLLKYGDNSMYAIPAESFRGDCWLATLYWTGIIREPRVFVCPATYDSGRIPGRPPRDLASGRTIAADAVSYAGLCCGLKGKHAHRNTDSFTESAISSACVLACDDNEGTRNHSDGMNVVYFDSHVEFVPGKRTTTHDLVGAAGSPYEHLDNGEE